MSFKCGICNETSKPREKATRIVTETRSKQYPFREHAHSNGKDDPGGVGTEIVTEVLACEECAAKWKKEHPVIEEKGENQNEQDVYLQLQQVNKEYTGIYQRRTRRVLPPQGHLRRFDAANN
jgi:hypothetical protein